MYRDIQDVRRYHRVNEVIFNADVDPTDTLAPEEVSKSDDVTGFIFLFAHNFSMYSKFN